MPAQGITLPKHAPALELPEMAPGRAQRLHMENLRHRLPGHEMLFESGPKEARAICWGLMLKIAFRKSILVVEVVRAKPLYLYTLTGQCNTLVESGHDVFLKANLPIYGAAQH